MNKYLKALVLFEGTASEKIFDSIENTEMVYKYFNKMETAIKKAYELANNGDMIILCPGGSSFNMFANEFDRGDQFVKYVKSLS